MHAINPSHTYQEQASEEWHHVNTVLASGRNDVIRYSAAEFFCNFMWQNTRNRICKTKYQINERRILSIMTNQDILKAVDVYQYNTPQLSTHATRAGNTIIFGCMRR